ncbi:ABC transporter ATP-binding protein [Neisseria chenwenguii]|uniref:Fe3+/spermidine/putrescine ABC transporter ATP-binding protein n=1 Tax=Neisseria chenwenguii TaxID=1853278 RepID=A0A220RZZ2_9NEIS|nr:ATP-binding cassette domain-containing protein [Neisseria chenwenguii]ASK26545.1 Fe3+/spermidine/putrescine ABC transporter ATP-binding protein [Neisseria chenwenguii]ROV55987.1 ATP-binding cassette domain-containing protein [Neisseria chenwenguii]
MLFDIDLRKKLPAFELNARLQSDAKRLVILGASGSGKSLTLQLLAGLVKPDGGHIRIGGETWFDAENDLPAQARKVGLLFQDYALFPHLTVAQNIDFGLNKGWRNPPKRPSEKAVRWLELLKISHIADHYPQQISGGQKQRTALARALVTEPELLLLDEPFAALDTDLRAHTRQEVLQIQQTGGVPMILITHDQADAAVLAEEVWRMDGGRLAKEAV